MNAEFEVTRLQRKVARLERLTAFLLEHLKLDYEDDPEAVIPPEVIALPREGNTIEAIKRYREATGVGLAEAKAAVEGLLR